MPELECLAGMSWLLQAPEVKRIPMVYVRKSTDASFSQPMDVCVEMDNRIYAHNSSSCEIIA